QNSAEGAPGSLFIPGSWARRFLLFFGVEDGWPALCVFCKGFFSLVLQFDCPTTEGHKVEIAASAMSPQRVAHAGKPRSAENSKPASLKTTRMRHPFLHPLPAKRRARMIYSPGVT